MDALYSYSFKICGNFTKLMHITMHRLNDHHYNIVI